MKDSNEFMQLEGATYMEKWKLLVDSDYLIPISSHDGSPLAFAALPEAEHEAFLPCAIFTKRERKSSATRTSPATCKCESRISDHHLHRM